MDASGLAAGGVLMQDQGQGLHPLAFMSRALKPTEQRYSAYERALAAIAYCFIQWRHYLEGCTGGVTVMMDQAVDPPDGSASLVPVSGKVDSAWIAPIYPAEDHLSAGQGQYCRRRTLKEQTPSSSSIQGTKPDPAAAQTTSS